MAHHRARTSIVSRSNDAQSFIILCVGFALRANILDDGRRQIIGVLPPGSTLRGLEARGGTTVCPFQALTDVQVASFNMADIYARAHKDYAVLDAALRDAQDREDSLIKLMTVLGRCTAIERVATFLTWQIAASGQPIENNACVLRAMLRQEDIADLLGLTVTHVNRTLSQMRKSGWISTTPDVMRIENVSAIAENSIRTMP